MLRLWKKSGEVQVLVHEHLGQVRTTIEAFLAAARCYLKDSDEGLAHRLALQTHRAESAADEVRRRVERALIGGALLASSRRQVLEIIERVDTLANAAEATLDYMLVQRVDVPEEIAPFLLDVLDVTATLFDDVEAGIHALFSGDRQGTLDCTERIERAEGAIDRIERQATKRLFRSDLEMAQKLHVHGLIDRVVKISDRAENLADRIAMITAEKAF